MLRLILNSHSNISVPPESGFALWNADKYSKISAASESYIDDYISDVTTSRKFETWGLKRDEIKSIILERKPTTYTELVDSVYFSYAAKSDKNITIAGDKNNYYIDHIPELLKHFPDEKLLLLIRDGRDVAVSYKNLNSPNITSKYRPQLPTDIQEISRNWKKNGLRFLELINGRHSKRVKLIRYEDLLNNPQDSIKSIMSYLGLEYEDTALQFHLKNDEPAEFLEWKKKTMEPIDRSNQGKHKTFLSKTEISKFNIISGEVLEIFGYKL